jgi:tetratricopeptide (TPR) repeat protein
MVTFLENPLVLTSIRDEDPRLDPRLDDLEGKGKDPIMQLLRSEFGVDSRTPLRAARLALTRTLNDIRLLGNYALKTVLPVRLSVDYGYREIPVHGLGRPALWAWAGGVVLALGGAILFLRRRLPIAALAAVVFLLALIPQANFLAYARNMFAERYAYAAAFAWPLLLCALAGRFPGPLGRKMACSLLGVLFLLYAFRTGVRAREWSDASRIMARTASDAPASTLAPLWSAAENVTRWQKAPPSERPQKKDLIATADALLRQSLANDPTNARAHALHADVLLYSNKWREAIASLNEAEEGYLRQYPPERKPMLYERRAQIYWLLRQHKESFEDYDLAIRLLEGRGQRAQSAAYSARGLLRAQLAELNARPGDEKAVEEELRKALLDFDIALLLKPDDLAIWNDRGFCRFKLKDYEGAIDDYRQGLEVAKEKGILTSPQPGAPSVMSFHEKLANAHLAVAQREQAAGNEGSARTAQAEAQNHAREAARLGSPHFKIVPRAPAPGTEGTPAPAPGGVGTPEPGAAPAPVAPGAQPEAPPGAQPAPAEPAPESKD